MININYHKITKQDVANGPGIRVTLWISGCNHHCKGCQNPDTWNPRSGTQFDVLTMNELLEFLSPDYIRGLTLSGGDPLYPNNRSMVELILAEVKHTYPNKDVWVWTGYLWEEVRSLHLMKYVDVLVDGEYVESLHQLDAYHGSTNQRVIRVQESLDKGEVILYE